MLNQSIFHIYRIWWVNLFIQIFPSKSTVTLIIGICENKQLVKGLGLNLPVINVNIVTPKFKFFFNIFIFTIFGSYQEILFSMIWYMFLVKNQTNGPTARCLEESFSPTFDNCFGVKNSWFKYMAISSKKFVIYPLEL